MTEQIIDSWIGITHGMSGWFACHFVIVRDSELGDYQDVQQTGIGRYKNSDEARLEAKMWADAEELRYIE